MFLYCFNKSCADVYNMEKTLTIVFSNKCNLSCSFCCVKDSLNKGEVITAKEAYNFIEWQILLDTKKDYLIEFFGGEPTVHYKDIKELFEIIRFKCYEDSTTSSDFRLALEKLSYRIYTNGVYNSHIKNDKSFWSMFDDIILSVEGEYTDSIDRHPNKYSYDLAISNYKDLLTYANVGIAFVLAENTDVDRIFKYFQSMGTRYYTYEVMTLINDDKDGRISLNYLYKVFENIYQNILLHNINNFDNYYIFSIPKELLAGYNYFTNSKHYSCLDTMRSLSPSGNIYFCRDLAVSEEHLYPKSSDDNVFFKSNTINPFNIKDLQLDKDSDSFLESARKYDVLTACPVKSFEFIHLTKDMSNPIWIKDKDFQDLLIRPLFELMWDTFHIYHKTTDINFYNFYKKRVEFYGEILEKFKNIYSN